MSKDRPDRVSRSGVSRHYGLKKVYVSDEGEVFVLSPGALYVSVSLTPPPLPAGPLTLSKKPPTVVLPFTTPSGAVVQDRTNLRPTTVVLFR